MGETNYATDIQKKNKSILFLLGAWHFYLEYLYFWMLPSYITDAFQMLLC